MLASTKLTTIGLRLVLFTALWWIITEGKIESWYLGIPVVILATMTSIPLWNKIPLSFTGLLRFIPFFLWNSLRGGSDVAVRALMPKLNITPGMVKYNWQLPAGTSQVFMANVVSLLPGTLSAEIHDDYLYIHALDETEDYVAELKIIEERVVDLFGIKLEKN